MGIGKDYQPELFNQFSDDQRKRRKFFKNLPRNRKINMVISQDKLIVFMIAVIILFIIVFSLGVERGKKLSLAKHSKKAEYVAELPPAVKKQSVLKNQQIKEELFTIQVAAYRERKQAKEEVKKLKKNNYNAFIINKGIFNVVYVGKFKDKQGALKKYNSLKNKYRDCFIKKITIKDREVENVTTPKS